MPVYPVSGTILSTGKHSCLIKSKSHETEFWIHKCNLLSGDFKCGLRKRNNDSDLVQDGCSGCK